MAEASYVQSSFLGGEWSQTFQGRVDRPDYRTGMNTCLNGLPIEAGSWTRRPGFRYSAWTRNGLPGKLLKFDFKASTPYNIELTDSYMRFFADRQLAYTNDAATVASISTANPAVVQTSAAHGWTTGNQGVFAGLSSLCPLLHNRQFVLTVVDSTHVSLSDPITGATIDGSTLGWSTPGTLPTLNRVLEIASPYVGGIWASVRMIQAESKSVTLGIKTVPQAVFLHNSVTPRVLEVTRDPTDANYAEFSLSSINFKDGPYFDPVPGNTQVTPGALVGVVTLTLSFPAYDSTKAYDIGDFVTSSSVNYKSLITANLNNTPASVPTAWVAVSASSAIGPNGFQGSDIGRHVRLFSEPPAWVAGTTYSSSSVVKYNNGYFHGVASSTGVIPGTDITKWIPITGASYAIWTWGKITSLVNQISQSVTGASNIGDMTGSGGLTAAFNGITDDPNPASKSVSATVNAQYAGYVGRKFNGSGGSAIPVSSVTLYPGQPGFGFLTLIDSQNNNALISYPTLMHFNLWAKASAPANATDGTLLASSGDITDMYAPITLQSNDALTTWNYVWIEVRQDQANPNPSRYSVISSIYMGELQYFGPPGATSNGVNVQILGDPLLYTNPIVTWRLGLFNSTTGYPSVGTFHEGRLWLSGVIGNRIDSSVAGTNNIFNFAPTAPDGTVGDANAISYTFSSPDVNPITDMIPDQQGIICNTKAGEWLVQATNANLPLTPLTTQAHRVTKIGAADAETVRCDHALAFIHRGARKLQEYFPDVYSGKFTSPNLTEKSKHLTKTGLVELAYQQELAPIIWARRTDGKLVGWTYKRENLVSSQGPTFIGGHQHTLGSGQNVISLRTGPAADGTTDTLGIVGQDPASMICHVEFLDPLPDEDAVMTDAMFLDDMHAPSVYQNIVLGGNSYMQLSGLWHLNGKTVAVLAGGLDLGDYAVTNGQISVPYSSTVANGNFTTAFVSAFAGAMPVLVGFTYTSRGQILRAIAPQESGARNGPALAKLRRSDQYGALLIGTRGVSFGTSFVAGKMVAAKFTTGQGTGQALTATGLWSGVWREPLTGSADFDSMIGWEITRPYPANVAAISGFPKTQDI